MLLLGFISAASAAYPVLGVDFVPTSRADLIWVDEDQSSGTLVGEFDGLIRPPLSPYGGFRTDRTAVLFGLGLARTSRVTWTGEERRKVVNMGLRPSVDVQYDLTKRQVKDPAPWVGAGAFGVVPIVRDVSTSYEAEEEDAVAEGNRDTRARIGGYGGRAGVGADYLITEELSIGCRATWSQWRGQSFQEDSLVISTLSWGEAALRLQYEF